eukprot:4167471-Alexandrium_andersonii.AAC.1
MMTTTMTTTARATTTTTATITATTTATNPPLPSMGTRAGSGALCCTIQNVHASLKPRPAINLKQVSEN